MMERMWSKRRILEVYMNSVEFGKNRYGVEAAAQYYYGKSARSLTREQAAFWPHYCLIRNIIKITATIVNYSIENALFYVI